MLVNMSQSLRSLSLSGSFGWVGGVNFLVISRIIKAESTLLLQVAKVDIISDANVITWFAFELNRLVLLGSFCFRCFFVILCKWFMFDIFNLRGEWLFLCDRLVELRLFLVVGNVVGQFRKWDTIGHELGIKHAHRVIHGKKIVYFYLL